MAAPSPAASGVSTEASSGLTTPATENIDNLAAFFTSNTQQFYFGFWGSVFDGIQMDISCDEPRNYSFAYLFQDGMLPREVAFFGCNAFLKIFTLAATSLFSPA